MTARLAAYYAPAPDDPLARAAAAWLGRDAFGTEPPSPAPSAAPPAEETTSARQYGFHATLKPPCALASGATAAAFRAAAARVAAQHAAFDLPPLRPTRLGRFLALTLTEPCPELDALARALVTGLDPLRAPMDDAERASRRAKPLTPAEDRNLDRWGYPHVLDTWTFHMTLTDALPPERLAANEAAAHAHFAHTLGPRRVDAVTIFGQHDRVAPFWALATLPLAQP